MVSFTAWMAKTRKIMFFEEEGELSQSENEIVWVFGGGGGGGGGRRVLNICYDFFFWVSPHLLYQMSGRCISNQNLKVVTSRLGNF